MDLALTAQFWQNNFSSVSNVDTTSNADDIRSLMGVATGSMLLAGELLQQRKDKLGKDFKDWLYEAEFVPSDANKLIKLFEYFGHNFDALMGVSPLQLLRLLIPSQQVSRSEVDKLIDSGATVTCADVDSICTTYRIKPLPTIKRQQPVTPEPTVELEMVGNQQGGTGIFRLEIKEPQLANELDSQWKESSMSAPQWMRFMSSSARTVQEISQLAFGRNITHSCELDELMVVVKEAMQGAGAVVAQSVDVVVKEAMQGAGTVVAQSVDVVVSVDSEAVQSMDELPTAVSDRLTKIQELDRKIASYTNPIGTDAMARRMHREERSKVIAELKTLVGECELDIEALLFRLDEQVVAVKS